MIPVVYDGSFEGLLTAIFEIYEYKLSDPLIIRMEVANTNLFGDIHLVEHDDEKAKRVYKKLKDKLTPTGFSQLYKSFLSEGKDIENIIYRYVSYVMASKGSVENNFAHPDVLQLQQISRKVHREKHRMEAFIRFELSKDGLFYCLIQPDFNVLPLIKDHFEKRYADQRWLIYDSRRKYGLYYDLEKTEEISMQFDEGSQDGQVKGDIIDEKEELYQKLWQQYFTALISLRAKI